MSDDAIDSGKPSGKMSPNGPPPDRLAASGLSEAAFLSQEAAKAKAAIIKSLHAIQEDVRSAADFGGWTREHPWMAVGIASLAGFALATAIRSPKKETNRPPANNSELPPSDEAPPEKPSERPTLAETLGWLVAPLSILLKTIAEKFIAALIAGASVPPGITEPPAGASESPETEKSAESEVQQGPHAAP